MGNLGQPGDFYAPQQPIYDWIQRIRRNKSRKNQNTNNETPSSSREERDPYAGVEAMRGHSYDSGVDPFLKQTPRNHDPEPRASRGQGREENQGRRPNSLLSEAGDSSSDYPDAQTRSTVRNIKGAQALMNDSLLRSAGAFGRNDSGSLLGTAQGEGSLSQRNPSRKDGIYIEKNTGILPSFNDDDPRPIWDEGRNEGWLENAQGFREDRNQALATDFILQRFLKDFGYNPGEIDGYFGPQSKKALEEFQRDNNIEPSGSVDEKTREAIRRKYNALGNG